MATNLRRITLLIVYWCCKGTANFRSLQSISLSAIISANFQHIHRLRTIAFCYIHYGVKPITIIYSKDQKRKNNWNWFCLTKTGFSSPYKDKNDLGDWFCCNNWSCMVGKIYSINLYMWSSFPVPVVVISIGQIVSIFLKVNNEGLKLKD